MGHTTTARRPSLHHGHLCHVQQSRSHKRSVGGEVVQHNWESREQQVTQFNRLICSLDSSHPAWQGPTGCRRHGVAHHAPPRIKFWQKLQLTNDSVTLDMEVEPAKRERSAPPPPLPPPPPSPGPKDDSVAAINKQHCLRRPQTCADASNVKRRTNAIRTTPCTKSITP